MAIAGMIQRISRIWQRRLLGASLITIAAVFAALAYLRSPWQNSVIDFLIRPFALFAVPMLLVGVGVLREELSRWTYTPLPVVLVPLGIGMLVLVNDWPSLTSPTGWEDSYTTLAVIESACWQFFVPLWIVFVVVLIRKRRTFRNNR